MKTLATLLLLLIIHSCCNQPDNQYNGDYQNGSYYYTLNIDENADLETIIHEIQMILSSYNCEMVEFHARHVIKRDPYPYDSILVNQRRLFAKKYVDSLAQKEQRILEMKTDACNLIGCNKN